VTAAAPGLGLFRGAGPARFGEVAALLMLGGWLALHAGGVILTLRADGAAALLVNPVVGPLEVLAAWVAAEAMWRGAADRGHGLARAALWVFALGLLLPSSLAAALLLAGVAALLAWEGRGEARWGAIGMPGLGLQALWLKFGQDWPGGILIDAEATVTRAVLGLFGPGMSRDGHFVRRPDGYGIVILPGCSVGQLLLPAVAAFAVLLHRDGAAPGRGRFRAVLGLLVLALAATNAVRLGLLAWSPATYAWGHGAFGANLFGLAGMVWVYLLAEVARADA